MNNANIAQNVYNDLPKDVKSMIDDYTGVRPPSTSEIKREALKRFCCGNIKFYNPIKIFKWIGIISIWTFVIIAIIGCAYLWALVLPNGIALWLFDDTYCGPVTFEDGHRVIGDSLFNQWCHAKRGNIVTPYLNGFVSVIIVNAIAVPFILGILQLILNMSWCCGCCNTIGRNFYNSEIGLCCGTGLYISYRHQDERYCYLKDRGITPLLSFILLLSSYIAFAIIASIWIGKRFATHIWCSQYSRIAIMTNGMCQPELPLGTGMGTTGINYDLYEGTKEMCTACMARGYWSVFALIVVIPIALLFSVIIAKKCYIKYKDIVQEVEDKYNIDL